MQCRACRPRHVLFVYMSKLKYSFVQSTRPRQVHGHREPGRSSQWQGEEDPEASDHLLQSAAAGSAPALPADPVPGLTGARRPGGQTGTHPDSGGPSTKPAGPNGSGKLSRIYMKYCCRYCCYSYLIVIPIILIICIIVIIIIPIIPIIIIIIISSSSIFVALFFWGLL